MVITLQGESSSSVPLLRLPIPKGACPGVLDQCGGHLPTICGGEEGKTGETHGGHAEMDQVPAWLLLWTVNVDGSDPFTCSAEKLL